MENAGEDGGKTTIVPDKLEGLEKQSRGQEKVPNAE